MDFDETYWVEVIKQPDWYLDYTRFIEQAKTQLGKDSEETQKLSKQIRKFFETALKQERVFLAESGTDFDKERLPSDTIVIHHTSSRPGYRLSFLNAVHLLNIYTPAYSNGLERGQPIWSGHFYKGRQVFWGYHWLMRMDGSFERLLDDDQIGWHAGNWDINRRSIAVCLDNDYEGQDPTDEILQKLAVHIQKNYPSIKKIIGHREARQGTICPGNNFLIVWKPKLIEYLSNGS